MRESWYLPVGRMETDLLSPDWQTPTMMAWTHTATSSPRSLRSWKANMTGRRRRGRLYVIATARSQCTRQFGSGGVGAVAVPVSGRHIDVAGPRSNRISTCVEGLD